MAIFFVVTGSPVTAPVPVSAGGGGGGGGRAKYKPSLAPTPRKRKKQPYVDLTSFFQPRSKPQSPPVIERVERVEPAKPKPKLQTTPFHLSWAELDPSKITYTPLDLPVDTEDEDVKLLFGGSEENFLLFDGMSEEDWLLTEKWN